MHVVYLVDVSIIIYTSIYIYINIPGGHKEYVVKKLVETLEVGAKTIRGFHGNARGNYPGRDCPTIWLFIIAMENPS
jgi:hypothetical protein